jgi:hypothetical protein
MTSRFLQFFLALVLCATLAPTAYAKGGHGNGRGGGSDKQDKHKDKDKDRDHHADRDHDRDGDHDRDNNDKRPAGWDKGKKTGWGDCDVPPGQVKKLGCHPNSNKHHAVHRDRDRDHDRNRVRDRDRDRQHVRTTKQTTTNGSAGKTTTTTQVPAQTREQARRTGGKVFNDDGTWHYANQPAPTTAIKK